MPRPVRLLEGVDRVLLSGQHDLSRSHSLPSLLWHPQSGSEAGGAEGRVPEIFWSSRACLALHLLVIVAAVVLPELVADPSVRPLPRLYGGILMWTLILAQHSGLAEDVLDCRLNTRTIRLNPVPLVPLSAHGVSHGASSLSQHPVSFAGEVAVSPSRGPDAARIQRIVGDVMEIAIPVEAKSEDAELFHQARSA